jgi:hypothetical protein
MRQKIEAGQPLLGRRYSLLEHAVRTVNHKKKKNTCLATLIQLSWARRDALFVQLSTAFGLCASTSLFTTTLFFREFMFNRFMTTLYVTILLG